MVYSQDKKNDLQKMVIDRVCKILWQRWYWCMRSSYGPLEKQMVWLSRRLNNDDG
jgi:hypothetical protein